MIWTSVIVGLCFIVFFLIVLEWTMDNTTKGEYVNPSILTQTPRGRLKWPSAITKPTAHICGLVSDLVIASIKKKGYT